jgi:hypothetical protein
MTPDDKKPGAKTFHVRNQLEVIEFEGKQISGATTERPEDPRWTEINIYKTAGGSYVIQRIGRSVVYHVHGSECNYGIATRVDKLPEDAEPCNVCNPGLPEDLDPEDIVDFEIDIHSAEVCNAAELPHRLTHKKINRDTGKEERFMSSVSRRALQGALDADADLTHAVMNVRKVS